jgi:hypothetical protein
MLPYVRLQRARDRLDRRLAARKEALRDASPPRPKAPTTPREEKPRLTHAERQAQRLAALAARAKGNKRRSLELAAEKWTALANETDQERATRIEAEMVRTAAVAAARATKRHIQEILDAARRAKRLLREAMEMPDQRAERLEREDRVSRRRWAHNAARAVLKRRKRTNHI